ncbi:GPI anchored serine-rich protein [Aspergillus clavatus NRRL 1]|uniref:GPI anchored serine-rich protein n=1 Tax=Aspergillus clavatus (strain ATCC 1007 / CBS 513.65 / DSM 816 / NCTC 3887 / NRRL 1 / QM 1276 / 107) TaxID=344612 RepID=A1CR76_ASPCL|nr:GPI anchored serine-rich protein [Aspergillus clavatus NRRL 1]EAW08147.1 GPI anchored serine-rich protein [Aspergillus clavatus NRRL 1]
MRFTAASIALLAGLAAALPNGAVETVYETEDVTITSCAPTVTNCPARATTPEGAAAVTTHSVPTVTASTETTHSVPTVTASTKTAETVSTKTAETGTPAGPSGASPEHSSSSLPVIPVHTNTAPSGHGVTTSVIAVTTCVPTVTYSTITVPVATPSGPAGGSGHSSVPVIPSGAGPTGKTTPSTTALVALSTGGANAIGHSFAFAGAAAAAALFLA